MNKIIKSIHEQLGPDKRMVNDLLEQIKGERVEEVRHGVSRKLWLAVPAVACIAVCAMIFSNINSNEMPMEKTVSDAAVSDSSSDLSEEQSENRLIDEIEEWRIYVERFADGERPQEISFSQIDSDTAMQIKLKNQKITLDGLTYVYDESDITSEDIEEYVGSGKVRVGDEVYTVGVGRPWYAASTHEIGITFDGKLFYFYVNPDYEVSVSSVEISVEPYGENNPKKEFVDDPGVFTFDVNLQAISMFEESDGMEYDGGYYTLDGKTEISQDQIGENIGDGYLVMYIDDLKSGIPVWVYEIKESDDLLLRFSDDTWYLFNFSETEAGGEWQTEISNDDQQSVSHETEQPSNSDNTGDTNSEPIVNSAEYVVDVVYNSGDDPFREEISMLVSDEYKQQITEKADTIRFEGKDYVCTGEILDFGQHGKALGKGRLIINGDTTLNIWIYEADPDPMGVCIAVDIGDWKAIVYRCTQRVVEDTVTSAVCSLTRFENPEEVMRSDDFIQIPEPQKLMILEKLASVEFDGREYFWSGEYIKEENRSFDLLGGGDLVVDGNINADNEYKVWVYKVKGVSYAKEIALDIGDHVHCRFVCK